MRKNGSLGVLYYALLRGGFIFVRMGIWVVLMVFKGYCGISGSFFHIDIISLKK